MIITIMLEDIVNLIETCASIKGLKEKLTFYEKLQKILDQTRKIMLRSHSKQKWNIYDRILRTVPKYIL